MMKKTILAFILMIIGMGVATAQSNDDNVCTFRMKLHYDPSLKREITINTARKEICTIKNGRTESRMNYYDFHVIDITRFSFSLVPDKKAPRNNEEFAKSKYCFLFTADGIFLSAGEGKMLIFEYEMPEDEMTDQFVKLIGNLTGMKSEESSSSSSSKPLPGTTGTKRGPNTTPDVKKEMTELQMVMYPFGMLTKNRSVYTNQQVKKELTALFKDNVMVEDSMAVVTPGDVNGYDYSYNDSYPYCIGYFQGVRLSSWSYFFDFDKANYSQKIVMAMAVRFVNLLEKNDISLIENGPNDFSPYYARLRGGGREIEVQVNDGSGGDSWRLIVSSKWVK
jgi:hypothetical protein